MILPSENAIKIAEPFGDKTMKNKKRGLTRTSLFCIINKVINEDGRLKKRSGG